ncbi:MAG: M90 family metallopeptidase [Marinobacter sp.]|uniref:zinc-dependent peptidase n=1 Tax=Marinobacter sp. TaxID=50741 RepID=UPI0034A0A51E
MSSMLIYLVFVTALLAGACFYLFFYRSWRRKQHLEQGFPEHWVVVLEAQVPFYRGLTSDLKRQFEQHVQLFLTEKNFYGCDGFEVDERVRLTIAGHACLLILARPYSDYDEIRSILVYPDVYRVQEQVQDGLVVTHSDQVRAGEASSLGQVVLAWSQCEESATRPGSHHNVILHEFAHQLDYLDGTADGAPPLSGEQAEQWQQTMTQAYEQLRQSLSHQSESWLDPYGATEPAEFFAVLTETFFQQPQHLSNAQPAVYEALQKFYRIDPRMFCKYHN